MSGEQQEAKYFGMKWETEYGYAQAVRAGGLIFLSGQVGLGSNGEPVDGLEAQIRAAYDGVTAALRLFGKSPSDVVDETILVTDMASAAELLPAIRREVFGGQFRLASTLICVAALGSPELLVEIKCTAVG